MWELFCWHESKKIKKTSAKNELETMRFRICTTLCRLTLHCEKQDCKRPSGSNLAAD